MSRQVWCLLLLGCVVVLSQAQPTMPEAEESSQREEIAEKEEAFMEEMEEAVKEEDDDDDDDDDDDMSDLLGDDVELPPHLQEHLLKLKKTYVESGLGPPEEVMDQGNVEPVEEEEAKKEEVVSKEDELPEFPDIPEMFELPMSAIHEIVRQRIDRNELITSVVYKPDDTGR
ncbi:hypothetical protein CAPTEDRAFT_205006, partial [Capitella teleta]